MCDRRARSVAPVAERATDSDPMTDPTRVAGWGRLADGAVVTWTVAEGRRGRRWREVVADGAATRHALLLETDPDRRFSHLELARADGLWTFHPETDGTLHGNHVTRGEVGVRHVAGWPFADGDVLRVEGSPLADAALAWGVRELVAVGATVELVAVVIGRGGGLDTASLRVERLGDERWRFDGEEPFALDADGLPRLQDDERRDLEEA